MLEGSWKGPSSWLERLLWKQGTETAQNQKQFCSMLYLGACQLYKSR